MDLYVSDQHTRDHNVAVINVLLKFKVIDLDETKMEDGLKLCKMVHENNGIRCICLVAGGDGTIG